MMATPALAVAATDANSDVRRRAIEALGLVGAAGDDTDATSGAVQGLPAAVVTGVLGEAVCHDSDVVVRRVAALALMRVGKGVRPAMAQLRVAATELAATAATENGIGDKALILRKKLLGLVEKLLAKEAAWACEVTP